MAKKIGNIELYMGPSDVGGPDDLEKVIVDFIDKTNKRLFIAIQELDSQLITEAIIRARQRKVLVKLVLEADYLKADRAREKPFESGGGHEPNRILHDAILRSNIKVNSDFNPHIFHQKFIIRDSESVLTGSTNFTETGTKQNLNHIVIIHDKKTAKIYNNEFTEIQQGHFGKLGEGHDPKPEDFKVSNVRVKTLFAPDHSPEMEIMKQIAKAQNRVDFAIFTFAKSSGIDDQLVLAQNAGIKVRGALFKLAANQKWSARHNLKKANVELHSVPRAGIPSPRPRKLHHKLMVIDEQIIIAGSFNYTGPANMLNDENIIIIGNLEETDPDSIKKQKELAKYAFDEIERIVVEFGQEIT